MHAIDGLEGLAGCRLLRSFDGLEPPADLLDAIRSGRTSGVTLFRSLNVGSPEQVRALCDALQAARPAGDPPLVIGIDQEGGQLQAAGEGVTAWPGNLALGATRSTDLARRFGRAVGLEVAALGCTLDFAPVADVLDRSSATPLGTRSFGSEPAAVAALVAAFVEGIAETGIASVLKHFPGAGLAGADPHDVTPVLRQDRERLAARDLSAFGAGIAAGAPFVMPGHLAVPAVTGRDDLPATFSGAVLGDLLRGDLGFEGVIVSDAMNMGGVAGAGSLAEAAVLAVAAGVDLLLLLNGEAEAAAFVAVEQGIASGRFDRRALDAARERVFAARRRFDRIERPSLDILGCAEHVALAREIAEASVTLVADPRGVLPLRPGDGRVAVIAPVPADLTPAETSSYLRIELADSLRRHGLAVDEFVMPRDPSPAQVAALAYATSGHAVRIVGTFDAVSFPGQAALLRAAAAIGPTVAVALRSPYDAALVPALAASVCTYGIQPPQIEALADALLGCLPFAGRLPVDLTQEQPS